MTQANAKSKISFYDALLHPLGKHQSQSERVSDRGTSAMIMCLSNVREQSITKKEKRSKEKNDNNNKNNNNKSNKTKGPQQMTLQSLQGNLSPTADVKKTGPGPSISIRAALELGSPFP